MNALDRLREQLAHRDLTNLHQKKNSGKGFSFYKILFHFKAVLFESTILLRPPPTCNAYPIAIRVHGHCAVYAPPTDPPTLCHTTYHIGDGNIV